MNCFHLRPRPRQDRNDEQIASTSEREAVFHDLNDYLHWIALLITGDGTLARQSIVNATSVSTGGAGVFRDWLAQWAKFATAREAVRLIRDAIASSARHYDVSSNTHTEHGMLSEGELNVLSDEQIHSLHDLNPTEVVTSLDPLARSLLVIRGVQRASISDCALLIDVPRRSVKDAYFHALEWLMDRTHEKEIGAYLETSQLG